MNIPANQHVPQIEVERTPAMTRCLIGHRENDVWEEIKTSETFYSLLIPVDDDCLEDIVTDFDDIDFYWHSLDVPGKGIAYCGITLIPPTSMQEFISVIDNFPELSELKALMQKAYTENKWMIHFGL